MKIKSYTLYIYVFVCMCIFFPSWNNKKLSFQIPVCSSEHWVGIYNHLGLTAVRSVLLFICTYLLTTFFQKGIAKEAIEVVRGRLPTYLS